MTLRYSIPHSFRDVEPSALTPELLAQIRLSVLLGYGFALSLLGTGGLGSLAAFVIGLVARRGLRNRAALVGLRRVVVHRWGTVGGRVALAQRPTVLSLRP